MKKMLLVSLFAILGLASVSHAGDIDIYAWEPSGKSHVASARLWVEFFQKNLKCFRSEVNLIPLFTLRDTPPSFRIIKQENFDHLAAARENYYGETILTDGNKIIEKWQLRYPKPGPSTVVRLYLYDPRVVWAEALSSCPERENFTIAGVGLPEAKRRLSEAAANLPDPNTELGIIGDLLPREAFMPIENDQNDCQPMSYISELVAERARFSPWGPVETAQSITQKLETLWNGGTAEFVGMDSPQSLGTNLEYRHAVQAFSLSKRTGSMVKPSNLRMAMNPGASAQFALANTVVARLQQGKWTHLLIRESGNYGSWHNISVFAAERITQDGDSRTLFYTYNSQYPSNQNIIAFSEREQAFFATANDGRLQNKWFAWLNTNRPDLK